MATWQIDVSTQSQKDRQASTEALTIQLVSHFEIVEIQSAVLAHNLLYGPLFRYTTLGMPYSVYV